MQIVIDISKDRYDQIMQMDWKNGRRFFDEELRAIHDGKVLEQNTGGRRMKRGITFYIDDDVNMIAFCGTLCTQTEGDIRGVTMLNLTADTIAECSEWYVPVKGKAIAWMLPTPPYQSEIPTGAEGSDKECTKNI